MGNRFIALKCRTIHYFVKSLRGCKFVVKGKPWNPRTVVPHEHWWFHSILKQSVIFIPLCDTHCEPRQTGHAPAQLTHTVVPAKKNYPVYKLITGAKSESSLLIFIPIIILVYIYVACVYRSVFIKSSQCLL